MNSFGTKLMLLVAAVVAATSAAAAELVNASSASSVANELKEQLRVERAEHRAELKQLQDELAMWKASSDRGGDESVVDNAKVGGGGSGSSFFADVVVDRQQYKNKKSSFSPSSSLLVVPSSQQQRRLKSDKKNPPQPPPLPDPPNPNPNTIDPKCYPETTMEEFDFFYSKPFVPMALFPNGNANGDSTGWMNWPFNRGMSAITVGGAYSAAYSGVGGNPPTVFTIVANGNGATDGTTTGINIAAAQYSETDSAGQPSYQYHAQQSIDQLTDLDTVTAVTFIPPYSYNQQYQSWQPDTENLDTIHFLVGSAGGDVYPCSIRPGKIPGKLNLTPTCGGSLV